MEDLQSQLDSSQQKQSQMEEELMQLREKLNKLELSVHGQVAPLSPEEQDQAAPASRLTSRNGSAVVEKTNLEMEVKEVEAAEGSSEEKKDEAATAAAAAIEGAPPGGGGTKGATWTAGDDERASISKTWSWSNSIK